MNICGTLYDNLTYTEGHIKRHLGLLAEMALDFPLAVMTLIMVMML